MKKALNFLLYLVLLLILFAAVSFALVDVYLKTPNQLAGDKNVIIRKSTGALEIARILGEAEVIRFPHIFYLSQLAGGNARKFKAGEYIFAAGITPAEAARKLAAGEVVIHKITIPEGWNISDVRSLLLADEILHGEITLPMPEGSVLPETYHYIYGDTRNDLLLRMQASMDKALSESWENRAAGLPLNNKQEALILASIVEKETGEVSERARVAAIFINRLRRGMRLQTDPSVIYGIEQLSGEKMNRPLNSADLGINSLYNSYLFAGLPPTPIANPGIAAIKATLNPLITDELYFVATGSGGHNFAKTLDEHNKNVASYRRVLERSSQ